MSDNLQAQLDQLRASDDSPVQDASSDSNPSTPAPVQQSGNPLGNAIYGAAMGLASPVYGITQGLVHGAAGLGLVPDSTATSYDQYLRNIENTYQQQTPGSFAAGLGRVAGSIAPAIASGFAGGPAIAGQVAEQSSPLLNMLQGASMGALSPALGDGSYLGQKGGQAAFGGVLGAALPAAGNMLASLAAPASATPAANLLLDNGVSLAPGQQIGGSGMLGSLMGSFIKKANAIPTVTGSANNFNAQQADQFSNAVANTIGATRDGPQWMGNHMNQLGQIFDNLGERNPVTFTPEDIIDAGNIAKQAQSDVGDAAKPVSGVVNYMVGQSGKSAESTQGLSSLNGESQQYMKSLIDNMSGNPSTALYARQLQGIFDNAQERSMGQTVPNGDSLADATYLQPYLAQQGVTPSTATDYNILQAARSAWGDGKKVQTAITQGVGKNDNQLVSPAALQNAFSNNALSKAVYASGGNADNPLLNLAQAGASVLRPSPDSGTPLGLAILSGAGGGLGASMGAAALSGHPGAGLLGLAGTAASAALPLGLYKALTSNAMANYMRNGLPSLNGMAAAMAAGAPASGYTGGQLYNYTRQP